jgi:hypothetical protein
MKMYTIKKGTEAIVLRNWMDTAVDGELKSKQHFTTKDLNFFDTLVDPVRIANGAECEIPILNSLAAIGYAVFASEEAPDYAIAVQYNQVKVQ